MRQIRDNTPRKTRRRVYWGLKLATLMSSGCLSFTPPSPWVTAPTVVWTSSHSAEESSPDSVRVPAELPAASTMGGPTIVQASATTTSLAQTVTQPVRPVVPLAIGTTTPQSAEPQPPAVPKPPSENTVDLATAFQLAGMDSPIINLSREAVREAVAQQLGAQVLLLPNLTVGGNYHYHNGPLETSSGIIRTVTEQSLYFGLGARTLAAESVAFPGIRLFSHLGDALFEPLAARQNAESRRSMAVATENNSLLNVAQAYFDLLRAEVSLEALRRGEANVDEIVRLTTVYAKAGQGRRGDERRAETRASLVHRDAQEAEGSVFAASARLSGLLSLDPSVRLRTPGGAIQPIQLIDENEKLESLMQRGLQNRPEVRARIQEVALTRTRVRQERTRPFLPTLSMGFSAGGFGGGSNLTANGITQPGGAVVRTSSFGNFDVRTDFDVFAVWTLQNGGVGNRALTRRAEAGVGQAIAELERTQNEIREQISEAQAAAQAAARQIQVAQSQLASAQEGFREEMIRIKQTVGRPLETLDSFRLLLDAQLDILRAVVAFNAAQFRLFVAVGVSPLQSPEAASGRPVP